MSKAFDTVDRVRLREALEEANADPFLVEVVGMLHIEALYDMTASETKFSVATKRGIKQGCKLAPSLFAFVTGLLYRKLANQITQDELAVSLRCTPTISCFNRILIALMPSPEH